ncbi:MAG TPA: tyrosine/phenylalanine carboxypeptidase domain-containing protein, partial [Pricia sp.]|nr:tyrosine/phenylalanine carboxypeptidase domain-containing protein [Pricia sp.]
MENLETLEIDQLRAHVTKLTPGGRTVLKLPEGGFLFLEHDVPYLMVYRKRKGDKKTMRLAKTAASYLILGNDTGDGVADFLEELLRIIAQRFGSFLILEIREGRINSTEFVIWGPYKKLAVTLGALSEGLGKIEARYGAELTARIADDSDIPSQGFDPLFDPKDLQAKGGTHIGLEVPPAYRDGAGTEFPVYFRTFRNRFAETVQEALFEFIRVQTTSKLASYHALGKREIHQEVLKIDRKITAIQNSYSFLLLVAPINISQLKQRYFENGQKNVGTFHYRLLPVDPDILKRKLYNLDIHEIDDPALAYIYDEKREEIDQELTMLKERGSPNFFYSGIRMYGLVSEELLKEAQNILHEVPEESPADRRAVMNAHDFESLAEREFEYFRKMAPDYRSKVHIRKDMNIMMVSRGELYLPADYTLTEMEAQALIQHEIGTHALTYYNGSRQPLQQMAFGLAGYDALQEGIAVLAEYLAGALGANRLRTLAGRVVAGNALRKEADFDEIFDLLHGNHGFSGDRAFDITSRLFQGGGFLKDIVYLKGLLELREYLSQGGDLESLLVGK